MNENKNEGKVKILEMLAEGKITVEQSLELLAQFTDEEKSNRSRDYIDPRQINPNKRRDDSDEDWDGDWDEGSSDFANDMANLGRRIKESIEDAIGTDLSSIGSDISNSFREIGRDLEDVDINLDVAGLFGYYKHKSTITYISDPIPQSINQLKLLGKNAKVEIKGYNGDRLRITCKFNPKRADAQVLINEDNGSYEVLYD